SQRAQDHRGVRARDRLERRGARHAAAQGRGQGGVLASRFFIGGPEGCHPRAWREDPASCHTPVLSLSKHGWHAWSVLRQAQDAGGACGMTHGAAGRALRHGYERVATALWERSPRACRKALLNDCHEPELSTQVASIIRRRKG